MSFLNQLSKSQIVFLTLTLGLIFIFLFNPPYTSCEAQKDLLRQNQEKFLNWIQEDQMPLTPKKAEWKILLDSCQSTKPMGGCYELFRRSRTFFMDLNQLPQSCIGSIVRKEQKIQNFFWTLSKLMIHLAWNSQDQDEFSNKTGWFDEEEVYLFCQLRKSLKHFFPQNWNVFKKSVIRELTKDKKLSEEKAYDLSLFSISCSKM